MLCGRLEMHLKRRQMNYLMAGSWLLLSGITLFTVFQLQGLESLFSLQGLLFGFELLALLLLDRQMRKDRGVPVLIYHSVSDETDWLPWAWGTSVSVAAFESQLEVLKSKGFQVLSDQQLLENRQQNLPVPNKAVVLHFDDGYLDNHVVAAPVLRQYRFPATFFVATEFIDPGTEIRPDITAHEQKLCWDGYMNRSEIQQLDRDSLFRVESHGVGHGRVQISGKQVTSLSSANWRHMSWLAWQSGSINKYWYKFQQPVAEFGSPVFEHDSELTGRRWQDGYVETDGQFKQRVSDILSNGRAELELILGRQVSVFCWPFDRVSESAFKLALTSGFEVVTGGNGNNGRRSDWRQVSRLHIPDFGWGWRWRWGEKWLFYARLRLFQGNYYWFYLIAVANVMRKLRQRFFPVCTDGVERCTG